MARRRQTTDDGVMAAAAHLVTVILGAQQVEDHGTTEGAPAGDKGAPRPLHHQEREPQ